MTIVTKNSLTLSNVNDGTITHYAYAYSADGTDRFTTVYPNLNLLKGTKTSKSITGNNTVNQGGLLYSFDNNSTLNNQGFSVNDTITLEFDWMATNPASGLFILQWQGVPWGFSLPNINVSSTNGSGHVIYTYNIRAADVASTAVATGIGYRLDNIPTNTVITFSNVIIRKAKGSQHWMPSDSEATTADYPSYIGQYTDFTQSGSTNPSDYTWSLIRGNDGKDGANGKDGIAGKDGVGIKTTVITYAISTSGTTAPTTGWTSSVPSLVKGQYLWTKTVWTYTDNSSETGYSVSYISKDGNNGTDGLAGKDGVGLTSTSITYAGSTNGTTAPTTGWSPSVPSVPTGQFLWTKTVWRYSDNTSETGYSVAMMGPKGDKGDTGANGAAGKDGNGIKTTVITYAISTSGTTAPTSGWTTQVPTLIKGQYLWTKTVWTYTDNTNGTGYSVTYISKDGNNGNDGIAGKDGNGIKTTTITYVGSTSGTTVPTSGWTSTIPTVAAGSYLWTKTVWTYTDNTSEAGYSVAKMGNTGATGPAGPPGSTGAPGKIVSNTEPISLFTGLTWKYSGTTDLTARDGTKILAGTEYYWNGSKWTLYEVNAHNINGDNLNVTNGKFTDGTIETSWNNGPVSGSTSIEYDHFIITRTDSSVNTTNTIGLASSQGLIMTYTDNSTGREISVGMNFQGMFLTDSTGISASISPAGVKLSSDVDEWTPVGNITLGKAVWKRINNEITLSVSSGSSTGNFPDIKSSGTLIGTLPANARPERSIDMAASGRSANTTAQISINTMGEIKCYRWGGDAPYFAAYVKFFASQ